MNIKTKVAALLAAAAGTVFLLALFEIAYLALGDIQAGALRNEPETGWGFVIALFFFTPIAVGTYMAFYFFGKKYQKDSQKSIKPLWVVSAVAAVLVAGIFIITGKFSAGSYSKLDTQLVEDMSVAARKIDHMYYDKKGVLPSTSEVATFLPAGVTYTIVNEETFKYCGTFEKSTISNAYLKHPETGNSKVTKKVVDGATLEPPEYIGIYSIHGAGIQCYTIHLPKPI